MQRSAAASSKSKHCLPAPELAYYYGSRPALICVKQKIIEENWSKAWMWNSVQQACILQINCWYILHSLCYITGRPVSSEATEGTKSMLHITGCCLAFTRCSAERKENSAGLKENNWILHMIPTYSGNCQQTSMLTKGKRKPQHCRYCIDTYWCTLWRWWHQWCWSAAGYAQIQPNPEMQEFFFIYFTVQSTPVSHEPGS